MDLATLAYHKQVVIDYWRQTERKLQRACDVLDKLGDKIHDLKVRRDRATRDGHKPAEYSLQLSLSTLENTRNMYYEFASVKAQQMEQLWDEMQSVGITVEDLGVEHSYQDLNVSDISNDDEQDLDYESDDEDTLTHHASNRSINLSSTASFATYATPTTATRASFTSLSTSQLATRGSSSTKAHGAEVPEFSPEGNHGYDFSWSADNDQKSEDQPPAKRARLEF